MLVLWKNKKIGISWQDWWKKWERAPENNSGNEKSSITSNKAGITKYIKSNYANKIEN